MMHSKFEMTLLKAALAGAALIASPVVLAGTVDLGTCKNGDVYDQFSVNSDGNLSVTCTAVGPPPSAAGQLQFVKSADSTTEGGTVTIKVSRTGGTSGAISANWASADLSATYGSDYTLDATSGSVSFADSETGSKTIATMTTIDDSLIESTEKVSFTLSGLSSDVAGGTLGTSTETVSIIDNDTPAPPPAPSGCTIKQVTWPSGFSFKTNPMITTTNGQEYAFQISDFPARGKVGVGTAYATAHMYASISESPCDFSGSLGSACEGTNTVNDPLLWTDSTGAASRRVCGLTPGKTYYLNLRNSSSATGSDTCPVGANCTFYPVW